MHDSFVPIQSPYIMVSLMSDFQNDILGTLRRTSKEESTFDSSLPAVTAAGQIGPLGARLAECEIAVQSMVSTRILGSYARPFQPFLIPHRVPHGFTPRS